MEGKGTQIDVMAAHLSPFVRSQQHMTKAPIGPDGAGLTNAKIQMDDEAKAKHEKEMKKKDEELVAKTVKNMETESNAPVL